jgi:phosphatidylglycerophosphatase A
MSRNSAPNSVWRNPIHFLAFGFGSGAAPVAPGTFGTLVAVPIYLLLLPLNPWAYLAVVLVITLVGIWLCHVTSRDLGVHDHAGIVWDEIAGYLITMIAAPPGWQWIVAGFILFRIFDIIKPWPIGWVDRRVHGGLGIMLDDVLAAVFAWVVLQGAAYLIIGV